MLSSIVHPIELSLASSINPVTAGIREADIEAMPNPLKRRAVRFIHNAIVRNPGLATRAVNSVAGEHGLSIIGMGCDAIVYADDERVRKLHLKTAAMSDHERARNLAERINGAHVLAQFLGTTALKQNIHETLHPLVRSPLPIIETTQPFCDFDPQTVLITEGAADVDVAELERAVRVYPGLDSALSDLSAVSRRMFEDYRQLPDINGTQNLVVGRVGASDPELYLIDGRPIGTEHRGVQELILGQLGALDSALSELAF